MTLEVEMPPFPVLLRTGTDAVRLAYVSLKRVHPGIGLPAAAVEPESLVETNGVFRSQGGRRGVDRDATADVSGQLWVLVGFQMAQEVRPSRHRFLVFALGAFEEALCVSDWPTRLASAGGSGGPNLPGFTSGRWYVG